MTVVNYNSLEYEAQPKKQINLKGVPFNSVKSHFTYAESSANDGDTFVLASALSSNTVVKSIFADTPAMTAGADNDIMICKHGETTAVEVATGKSNLLVDGKTFATALVHSDILGSGLTGFDYSKSLGEITGLDGAFDIVLSVKTKATAGGTMCFTVESADNL